MIVECMVHEHRLASMSHFHCIASSIYIRPYWIIRYTRTASLLRPWRSHGDPSCVLGKNAVTMLSLGVNFHVLNSRVRSASCCVLGVPIASFDVLAASHTASMVILLHPGSPQRGSKDARWV